MLMGVNSEQDRERRQAWYLIVGGLKLRCRRSARSISETPSSWHEVTYEYDATDHAVFWQKQKTKKP